MALILDYTILEDDVSDQAGRRDIRVLWDVEDNNSVSQQFNIMYIHQPADTVIATWVVDKGNELLSTLTEQEKHVAIDNMETNDPLHVFTTFWSKKTPDWNTWNDLFVYISHYFWSLENKLDILPFRDCWGRVSSQDKSGLLGITIPQVSDMNGDMQTAYDTWTSLSTYLPYFDSNGDWIGS